MMRLHLDSAFGIRRAAFTLIELLAVLVIIGLLMGTFVPYALSIREASNRAHCEKNLHDIYDALAGYASANGYNYPRTTFDPTHGGAWTAFTGPDDQNPFAATSAVKGNDVTASLWLLVRDGFAQPRAFVCPSGDGSPDPLLDASGQPTVVKKRGNFRSPEHLNYAYASPFSGADDYRLNDTLPARFALVADRGPSEIAVTNAGTTTFDDTPRRLRALNSPNHDRDGQNVLYADGSVSFEPSPFCGVGRSKQPSTGGKPNQPGDGDDIYTALFPTALIDAQPKHNEPGVIGTNFGPAYRYDSMLVPAADFPNGYTTHPLLVLDVTPAPTSGTASATAAVTAPPTAVPPATAPAATQATQP